MWVILDIIAKKHADDEKLEKSLNYLVLIKVNSYVIANTYSMIYE